MLDITSALGTVITNRSRLWRADRQEAVEKTFRAIQDVGRWWP